MSDKSLREKLQEIRLGGQKKAKRGLNFYLRLSLSILLLYYVFQKVGWANLWTEIQHANLYYIALYISLGLLMTFLSVRKWLILVKAQGITASFPRLFCLYMVGYFFNNLLPTNVGGDVIRAYELGKSEGKKQEAIASVFMERFTGLTTLILFAVLAVALEQQYLSDSRLVAALGLAFVGYLAIVGIVFNRSVILYMEKWVPKKVIGSTVEKVQQCQEAIYLYKRHGLDMMMSLIYSILFYLTAILLVYVGCLVFDVEVPLSTLVTAVPVMYIVFMMPISVGGIGLQEWTFLVVLGMIGVPAAVALSVGLLCRAREVSFSIVGGASYALLRNNVGLGKINVAKSVVGSVEEE